MYSKAKEYWYSLVYLSPSQYLVRINVWDGNCKTQSKSVFYSYHPIYGRKLDYGNDMHPCLYDNMYNNNAFKSKRILVC